MIDITHAALPHACKKKKADIFMERQLCIDKAHTVLDIFRFAELGQTRVIFIGKILVLFLAVIIVLKGKSHITKIHLRTSFFEILNG